MSKLPCEKVQEALGKLFGHDWVEHNYAIWICRACNLRRRAWIDDGNFTWMYYTKSYKDATQVVPLCD